MQVYSETLDPSETKDYAFDWTPALATGEVVLSQVVTFVAAAGTTNPSNSLTTPMSRVWLSGGTHGSRAIYTIKATTDQGRTLEESFGVDIIDTAIGAATLTDVERITAEIVTAKATRAKVAAGEAIEDFWRDGRRIRRKVPAIKELNDLIMALERELDEATQIASGYNKRRPIGLAWRN